MKPVMKLLVILFHLLLAVFATQASHDSPPAATTSILFSALGSRSAYAFDIFTLLTDTHHYPPSSSNELKLTDGKSFNFNGHFPPSSSVTQLLSNLPNQNSTHSDSISVVYVTEREGSSNIYFDSLHYNSSSTHVQVPLLKGNNVGASFKDKPTVTGDYLVYVSTHEDVGKPRTSWAAVYSTELKTGLTQKLTPQGISDFSPSVSPSGIYTAVASYGEKGWNGEAEVLTTDIYIFLTRDGTRRVKVVENGGCPSWVDDSTIYFHRRNKKDGWISIYKAILPSHSPNSIDSVIVTRVTSPGLHAFTPATSPGNNKFIAVATRRPVSDYRHIELFDLVKREFIELTRLISPKTHHFNPFLSPDSTRVGYHKCRGGTSGNIKSGTKFMLENLKSPVPEISVFRMNASFPSWSPSGDRLAYVDFPGGGVYVVNRDGSNNRLVYPKPAFGMIWDPVRPGIVYTSIGPFLANESTKVDIISINVDKENSFKKLTTNDNNAFPGISPDGKWIVFRSGRSGHKNLHIMDAVKGEEGGLYRLTEGSWSDTMCNWSPNGEWIVFSSDRDNPGSGSFDLFLIHPNRTGLRKLFQSGVGGQANHPWFSPNGKSVVFTTDYSGISGEPISYPHMFGPFGEIFIINLDGSGLKRMTHNAFDDGTPTWGPAYIKPVDLAWSNHESEKQPQCLFEDSLWSWLNLTSTNNLGVKSLMSTKPRCGR